MKKSLCFCIFIINFIFLFSQTTIPAGYVSGNWLINGSPYLIEGEITIPDGETLSINPGVLVVFQGHYKLNVQGQLLAIGTEQDSIKFTIADTTGFSNPDSTAGGWHGIRFDETSTLNDSSKIKYSEIEYGKAIRIGNNWYDDYGGGIYIDTFSKVLISNSKISNNFAEESGGGICIWFSTCVIRNCVINDNSATHGGGGLIVVAGSPIISNNLINVNKAFRGGGIYCGGNSSAEFINNEIINNTTSSEAAGIYLAAWDATTILINNNISYNTCTGNHGGGGLYIKNSPILINNTISYNIANADEAFSKGGGIHFSGGACHAYLEDNIIEYNQANQGGGISCDSGGTSTGSSPTLINNQISNNVATTNGGGLLFLHDGNPILMNNIISTNYAGELGGGIYCRGSGSFMGNLISNNTANEDGGGIYIFFYSPILYNNDICFNISTDSGGGIYCYGSTLPIFINTIIWENNSFNGEQVFLHWYFYVDPFTGIAYECFPQPEFYYCDITDGMQGFDEWNDPGNVYEYNSLYYQNNIDSDPFFINPENGDFHFFANSPCINAGTPDTTGLNLPEYDLDGNPRIYEDIIDMGCYEWQGTGTIDEYISMASSKLSNYPNPFNPSTTIKFSIENDSKVKLTIYNIKGQKIKILTHDKFNKGYHSIIWYGDDENSNSVSSGVYLYKLNINGKTEALKKCILLK